MSSDERQGNHESILSVNSVLLGMLMLFTSFGNFILLMSIWKNKRLHKVTHMNTASLMLANFIPGLIIIPLRIARLWHENTGKMNEEATLCRAYLTTTLLWCIATILTLVSLSFDRYIAISRPEKYNRMLTQCNTGLLLLICWCFAILVAFVSLRHSDGVIKMFTCNFNLLRKENYVYLLITVEVIPLILMFVIHYQITKLSAKHVQSIGVVDSRFTDYREISLDFQSEVRWSRIVILIILLYVLMWAPRCIYLLVDENSMSTNSADAFDVLTEVVTYSFAGLVPLVLVHFNSEVRDEFFRILMPYQWFQRTHGVGKKYKKNAVTPLDTTTL